MNTILLDSNAWRRRVTGLDDRNENLTATGGNGADGIVIIYGIEDVDG